MEGIEAKKPSWVQSAHDSLPSHDQIHVWIVDLTSLTPHLASFWKVLSWDEHVRANSYKLDQPRRWFVLRRGFLRTCLAAYLGIEAASLDFSYSRYGKPFLKCHEASIDFNLSHSSGMAVFAFAQKRRIGIDLESRRDDIEPLDLAERYFSPYEINSLLALPVGQRIRGFYKCWTRKEAFIKAHGEGLSISLDQFDVNLQMGEAARLLATRGDLEPADEWSLMDIPVNPDFEAALAVYGSIPELQFFYEGAFQPPE